MDTKTTIWAIAGLPGVGKTTLLNKLTNRSEITGNSLKSITTTEQACNFAQHPVQDSICKTRFFCDTEGIGDCTTENVDGLIKNVTPTLSRIVKGITGCIICVRPERLLMQDRFILKSILDICSNIPIIICFTKYDEKFKTKIDTYEWISKERESFFDLLNIDDRLNFNFTTISCKLNDTNDLMEKLNRYNSYNYCKSKKIIKIREESNVEEGFEINDEEYCSIVEHIVKEVIEIARSPWFMELLKMVPFLGSVITIVDNILAHNKIYGVVKKTKIEKSKK